MYAKWKEDGWGRVKILNSWILHTLRTDTQGCSEVLADTKLNQKMTTHFDTETWKLSFIRMDHKHDS